MQDILLFILLVDVVAVADANLLDKAQLNCKEGRNVSREPNKAECTGDCAFRGGVSDVPVPVVLRCLIGALQIVASDLTKARNPRANLLGVDEHARGEVEASEKGLNSLGNGLLNRLWHQNLRGLLCGP